MEVGGTLGGVSPSAAQPFPAAPAAPAVTTAVPDPVEVPVRAPTPTPGPRTTTEGFVPALQQLAEAAALQAPSRPQTGIELTLPREVVEEVPADLPADDPMDTAGLPPIVNFPDDASHTSADEPSEPEGLPPLSGFAKRWLEERPDLGGPSGAGGMEKPLPMWWCVRLRQ